jgi:hypothetical protein
VKIAKYIEVISKIPPPVFHTWQVIDIFTNQSHCAYIPDDILKQALNLSTSQLYRRLYDTLAFEINDQKLLYLIEVKPEKVNQSGSIEYDFTNLIEVDDNGKVINKEELKQKDYGYKTVPLKKIIRC